MRSSVGEVKLARSTEFGVCSPRNVIWYSMMTPLGGRGGIHSRKIDVAVEFSKISVRLLGADGTGGGEGVDVLIQISIMLTVLMLILLACGIANA